METHGYYKDNMKLCKYGISISCIIAICLGYFTTNGKNCRRKKMVGSKGKLAFEMKKMESF